MSSLTSVTNWVAVNQTSSDPSLSISASIMALSLALNDFAGIQGSEISTLNTNINSITNVINLLRTYTPQGYSSGTTANVINLNTMPWSGAAANADLVTIMTCLTNNGLNTNFYFTNDLGSPSGEANVTWAQALATDGNGGQSGSFTQAGMNAWGQSLQAISTQLTTQVQTLTAQASQTTEMSNTMSQAVSSVLANMLQMSIAASKA